MARSSALGEQLMEEGRNAERSLMKRGSRAGPRTNPFGLLNEFSNERVLAERQH